GEGELMAHDVPLGCAPDEYDDLISGTCSHLPKTRKTPKKSIKVLNINNIIICIKYSQSIVNLCIT
ncbi:hypothetical protein, partial [Klebsiella pneumoniae]|uniref:hypothetical protein n=1 Tax=Klebsiella pneumoniae TaxID=573 RepID=UPI001C6E8A00